MIRNNNQSKARRIYNYLNDKTGGDFILIHRDLAIALESPALAWVFSEYMRQFMFYYNTTGGSSEWMVHQNEYVSQSCSISIKTLSRYKKALKKLGILKTKRQGNPAMEYITIDIDQLENRLVQAKEIRMTLVRQVIWSRLDKSYGPDYIGFSPKGKNPLLNDIKNKEKNTKKETRNPSRDWSIKLVDYFKKTLERYHPRKSMHNNPITYGRAFQKIREENGLSPGDIKELIKWYIPNLGKLEYFPIAYNPEDFHKKINKILDARERLSKRNTQGTSNRKVEIQNKRKAW